jgi:chemotaxis protein methyltransferase CheR
VSNVEELVDVLGTDRKSRLHRAEAEAKAIGETSFFRDWPVFELLREQVLPGLIARRLHIRKLRIWSAGCSTGQEAYSVAMLLCEHFPELAEWDMRIVGTDLSQEAVAVARTGRFCTREISQGLPASYQGRYMERMGQAWVVAARVSRLCEFVRADLREEVSDGNEFDLVLLRNVLLYLSPGERSRVLDGLRQQMAADGALVLGCGERAEDSTTLFTGELAPGCYVYHPAIGG